MLSFDHDQTYLESPHSHFKARILTSSDKYNKIGKWTAE